MKNFIKRFFGEQEIYCTQQNVWSLPQWNKEKGRFVCLNPFKTKNKRETKNVLGRRVITIEHDNLGLKEQENLVEKELPQYTAKVYSGNKSYHYHYKFNNFLTESQEEIIIEKIKKILPKVCQATLSDKARLVRLPGGTHETTKKQSTLISVKDNDIDIESFIEYLEKKVPTGNSNGNGNKISYGTLRDAIKKIDLVAFMQKKYGLRIAKNGTKKTTVFCPFHNDKHPSAYISKRTDGTEAFFCSSSSCQRGCNRYYDAIHLLVADGISFPDALIEIFGHKNFGEICHCGANIFIGSFGRKFNLDGTYHLCTPQQKKPEPEPIPKIKTKNFPLQIFPEVFAKYIQEECESFCSPAAKPDFIAMSLLAVIATACGETTLKIKEGWTMQGNIYVALIGEPGSKKSPSFSKAMAFARKIEGDFATQYEELEEEYNREKKSYDALKPSEKKETEEPIEPIRKRFFVSNATVESLARILNENKSVLMACDELSSWLNSFNQYKGGKGNDKQYYLSFWSNASESIVRVKGSIYVENPILSILGGIQPSILADLKGKKDDGMFQRFLFCYPPEQEVENWSNKETNPNLKRDVGLEIERIRANANRELKLSSEAFAMYGCYWELLKREEKEIFNNEKKIFWAKLGTQLGKIAISIASMRNETEVSTKSMANAIDFIEYYKTQVEKVLDEIEKTSEEVESDPIIYYVQRKNIKEFTIRDLYRAKVKGCRNAEEARKRIAYLLRIGKIQQDGDKYIIQTT